MKKIILPTLLLLFTLQNAIAQAGSFDPTFGSGGILTANIGHGDDAINSLALQSDGKLIVAGEAGKGFGLARYWSDGTLDTEFGTEGKTLLEPISGNYKAEAMAVQADDKIVVVGYILNSNYNRHYFLSRFLPNGVLDESFGDDGFIIPDKVGYLFDVAIQPDGKILAGGLIYDYTIDFAFLRYNEDGTPDETFGEQGFLRMDLLGSNDAIYSLAVQPDGKILAGGYTTYSYYTYFTIIRLHPNGSLDESFGTDGIVTNEEMGPMSYVNELEIQPDGKILAGGRLGSSFGLARYHTDGSLDLSFGYNGMAYGLGFHLELYDMVLQADGKILVCGGSISEEFYDFGITRFKTDGDLDLTFGINGIVVMDFGSNDNEFYALALQPDGKIVAGGYSYDHLHKDFTLARYNVGGTVDNSFADNGFATMNLSDGNDLVSTMMIEPDGKILAGGVSNEGINNQLALMRSMPDGSLDNSFGVNGTISFGVDSLDNRYYIVRLVFQPDMKIVSTLFEEVGSNYIVRFVRFTLNGELDTTFGVNGIVTLPINTFLYNLAFQPDGKILTGGTINNDPILVRFEPNGSIDSTFGINGMVATDFSINTISLQSDGKIIAGGHTTIGSDDYLAVERFHPDGTLDYSFSGDGKVTSNIGTYEGTNAINFQSDGKILISGTSRRDGYFMEMFMIRLTEDGLIDFFFGNVGTVRFGFEEQFVNIQPVVLQADGKIIAVGSTSATDNTSYPLIVRFLENGDLDPDFGIDGYFIYENERGNYSTAVLQPDQKIIVGGALNYDFALTRFLSGLEVGAIEFSKEINEVLIYPNPVLDEATLSYELFQSENLQIALYNREGKIIRQFLNHAQRNAGEHEEELNFSEIPKGVYFLTLENGEGKTTIQVIR